MENQNIIQTLLNLIVKQAFRATNLKQIGNRPRFFDIKKSIDFQDV
jgi:hypothetical protein